MVKTFYDSHGGVLVLFKTVFVLQKHSGVDNVNAPPPIWMTYFVNSPLFETILNMNMII